MIRFLLGFIPFAGPAMTILGFLPRLLKLKREKAIHAAVGDTFPEQYQSEIDAHTIRTKTAFYRLGMGLSVATAAVCGFQWYANDQWKDAYKKDVGIEKGRTQMAINDANQRYTDFVNLKEKYDSIIALQGAASLEREKLITVKTATKIKRAKKDATLPPATIIDAADWLRVESAGIGATPTSPSPISIPGSM